jgi:hypothetical protein
MKLDIKPSTALMVGGIVLAVAFLVIAIISPASLDKMLGPSDELSDQMKKEMERQKAIEAGARPDARPGPEEKMKSGAVTPTPLPEETAPAGEGQIRGDERIPKPECISRDQVAKIIGASEEARDGRVIEISGAPDGSRIMVAYRKKTFIGIGSAENQIEGILRRGLRNRFPDHLIRSVKVRSEGNKSVSRDGQTVNVEVLLIETWQAGCRWP